MARQDSHKKIIETLEVDSEVLDNIHEEFTRIVYDHGIRIHSFQEARGISGMKGLDEKVRHYILLNNAISDFTKASANAGSEQFLFEARSAPTARSSGEYRCEPYANG